jgi:hypothetical protein
MGGSQPCAADVFQLGGYRDKMTNALRIGTADKPVPQISPLHSASAFTCRIDEAKSGRGPTTDKARRPGIRQRPGQRPAANDIQRRVQKCCYRANVHPVSHGGVRAVAVVNGLPLRAYSPAARRKIVDDLNRGMQEAFPPRFPFNNE